jgi:glucose-6-phosphate 1-dehydrogenase
MSVSPGDGANPLLDGLRIEPTPTPTALVIFGASGDLTRRKLLPAVYKLALAQRLPARFAIVGVARSPMTDDQFRDHFHDSLKEFSGLQKPDEVSTSLAGALGYVQGEMDDPALYTRVAAKLAAMSCPDGVLFYLATPPSVYGTVVEQLGAAGLTTPATPEGWRRVIVEKPFGIDLDSARELNRVLHSHLDESQIFRIDH